MNAKKQLNNVKNSLKNQFLSNPRKFIHSQDHASQSSTNNQKSQTHIMAKLYFKNKFKNTHEENMGYD